MLTFQGPSQSNPMSPLESPYMTLYMLAMEPLTITEPLSITILDEWPTPRPSEASKPYGRGSQKPELFCSLVDCNAFLTTHIYFEYNYIGLFTITNLTQNKMAAMAAILDVGSGQTTIWIFLLALYTIIILNFLMISQSILELSSFSSDIQDGCHSVHLGSSKATKNKQYLSMGLAYKIS